jgi:hypothetical protein
LNDDTSRHRFELHYDDVDIEMKQVTKKGRVFEVPVSIGGGDAIADPSYSVSARLKRCVGIASALVYLHGREP